MGTNLFRKLKQRFLPPSSRSFHTASEDIMRRLDELSSRIDQVDNHVSCLEEHVSQESAIINEHTRLRFEALYRDEGETGSGVKKRFFASIPPAEGDLRLSQLSTAKLMKVLNDICRSENLSYWFAYGTLIAALSRHGFIPWDDDIDICMMRTDAHKLQNILSNDPTYQLSLVYDRWNLCKQLRFRLKNSSIPSFIDISIYDWAADYSEQHDAEFRKIRLDLMREFSDSDSFSYWNEEKFILAPGYDRFAEPGGPNFLHSDIKLNEAEAIKIEAMFSKYQEKAYDRGILCCEAKSTAIAYAIDNIYDAPWRRTIWPKQMLLPPRDCDFEEYVFQIPHDAEAVADECYPGWPYLPKDILGHNHINRQALSDKNIRSATVEFLADQ